MTNGVLAQRKALEATYEDWLEVWRPEEVKQGSITRFVSRQVGGSACGISQNGGGPADQTSSFNLVEYGAKLFAPPEIEIRRGDTLRVVRFGNAGEESTIVFAFEPTGDTAVYPTHQEIFVKVREKA